MAERKVWSAIFRSNDDWREKRDLCVRAGSAEEAAKKAQKIARTRDAFKGTTLTKVVYELDLDD